jgi:fructose-bisphosphate aldolase, class II
MSIATADQYAAMLDGAAAGGYAFAGVNVTSSGTLNAALRGFAQAGADGIVQVSTGGGQFLSGGAEDMALGARALAAFARVVGERCPVLIALHTDHCPPDKLDSFLRPLLAESLERQERGEQPLFHSQMFDGSTLPLEENLRIAAGLLEQCARAKVVLEIECGGVGGEEDGLRAEGPRERLYTTTEDLLRVAEVLAFATSSTAGQARLPRRSGMRSPTAW